METVTNEIKLKRLRLARDYWLNVPPDTVYPNFTEWFYGEGQSEQMFLKTIGFDSIRCGALACIAGHLVRMPEVVESCGPGHFYHRLDHLRSWLGFETESKESRHLFGWRRPGETGTDWEVALKRLDNAIADLEPSHASGGRDDHDVSRT